jgi:hypothetical protein
MSMTHSITANLITDRILGEAVDEIYGARNRGDDMRQAAHAIARRIAPLCVASGFRQVTVGLHAEASNISVGALAHLALELDGHAE